MLVKPVSARAQRNAEGCRLHQPLLFIKNDSHYQSHYRFNVTEPAGTVRVRTCIPYWVVRIVGCGVTVEKSPQGESCVTLHSANTPLPGACSSNFPEIPDHSGGPFRPFVAIVKKKTGFRRSELRGKTHEKACLTSIYDRNRDLIRAKPRRYHGRATALPSCMGD